MPLDLCLELLAFRVALPRLVSQCFHAEDTFQEGGRGLRTENGLLLLRRADLIKGWAGWTGTSRAMMFGEREMVGTVKKRSPPAPLWRVRADQAAFSDPGRVKSRLLRNSES